MSQKHLFVDHRLVPSHTFRLARLDLAVRAYERDNKGFSSGFPLLCRQSRQTLALPHSRPFRFKRGSADLMFLIKMDVLHQNYHFLTE
jgi:hypothetical protein